MKQDRDPTPLEYAILGLLIERPRTGYAVRKVFEETLLGHYSSSPGSIYPALSRLEKRGLLERASEEGRSTRRTQFFQPTDKGIAAMREWLARPVRQEEVRRSMPELILRFAFMDELTTRDDRKRFLKSLGRELDAFVEEMQSIHQSLGPMVSAQALWAFENGLAVYKAHAAWATAVLKKLGTRGEGR